MLYINYEDGLAKTFSMGNIQGFTEHIALSRRRRPRRHTSPSALPLHAGFSLSTKPKYLFPFLHLYLYYYCSLNFKIFTKNQLDLSFL